MYDTNPMPRETYDISGIVELDTKTDPKAALHPATQAIEKRYREFVQQHPENFFTGPEDGDYDMFEVIFASLGVKGKRSIFGMLGKGNTLWNKLRIFFVGMLPNLPANLKTKKQVHQDVEPYLEKIEKGDFPFSLPETWLETYPNKSLWTELEEFGEELEIPEFGFTKVPREFVFKDQGILFEHALVFTMEMKKEEIDKGPEIDAGVEVQRIYNVLGRATVKLTRWLQSKGIRAQGDPPQGAKVNLPPLAVKAGLGAMGHNGMLITPHHGQRVRIAAVYVEAKLFEYTDSDRHRWVFDYCNICNRCVNKCPTQAIYKEPVLSHEQVEGFGDMKTTIDIDKCTPFFMKTLGCSVCVKVCPFSQSAEMYQRLQKLWNKRFDTIQHNELIWLGVHTPAIVA